MRRVTIRSIRLAISAPLLLASTSLLLAGGRAEAAAGARELRGLVLDHETGEPVAQAIVRAGSSSRAESDSLGRFRFASVPDSAFDIEVTRVSYLAWKKRIGALGERSSHSLEMTIRLRPDLRTLEMIEVGARRPDPEVPQGKREIPAMTIRKSAGTVATDPLRAVQALPGAAAAGDDFADRYVVRGGDPEENLVLYDGYPLLQPIHLEGFTSVVYDDLIGAADVYPGPLPPRYGDALSSVTSLSPATVASNRRVFRYDLGSIALGALHSTGSADAIAAARTSFYNLVVRRPPGIDDRSFQDLAGRLAMPRGDREASLTFVGSRDRESGDIDRDADAWLAGVRYAAGNERKGFRVEGYATERDRTTVTEKAKARTRADLQRIAIAGGARGPLGRWVSGSADLEFRSDRFEGERLPARSSAGGFVSAEATRTDSKLAIAAGGRIEKIPFTDGVCASPYASLRYLGWGRVVPGAGARIVRQSPFLLTEAPEVAGLPVDPEDLLAAGDGNVKPLEARHAAASLQADLGAGLSAGVEAYWKEYRHLLQWDGDAQGGIAAGVRDTGTGRGRGVELSVRRDGEARRVRGWMTLSLSSTKKAEGPSAEMRPADQDRPWMVQAAVDLPIRGGTSLSFGYRAAAGRPITPLVPGGGGTLIAGEVNSTRLPDYHRFDVKLEHRIAGKGDGGEEAFLYLDVLNLFNQKNVVDVVQYVGAGGTPARIEVQGVRILPIAGFGFYF